MSIRASWFREQYEDAKRRNAEIPSHARMVITSPTLSAHRRTAVSDEVDA